MLNLFITVLCLHPLHISITEIEYNDKTHSLQIISRIFIDDLESSIQSDRRQPSLDILNPQYGLTTKQLIRNYLKQNFRIKLDGMPYEMNFLGYEEENFTLICYLEIENVKTFTHIEILNTLITEIYDDQHNITHLTYKGILKTVRLRRDNPSESLTF